MAEAVGIIGGGALGTLLMKHLLAAGFRIHALVRNAGRRLVLSRDLPEVALADDAASLRPAAVVFLCIKAYDTARTAVELRTLEAPRPVLCSLQNGWGNLEILEREIPGAPLVAGATALGAYLDDHGALHSSTRGATTLAPWGETPPQRAEEVARVLRRAGFDADVKPHARAILWRKLTLNAAVNPLTALAGRPNGALLEEPGLGRLAEQAALEAARVGGRLGHVEPDWNPLPALRALLEETRANFSSMAQDLARGRRTEIEAIAGAIVLAAEPLEEPVPVLRALRSLVRTAEGPAP